MTERREPTWRLYWCTTEDHDEDWFVVARSAAAARRYHEQAEGYARGDAASQLVAVVPGALAPRHANWPSRELLEQCGGIIERWESPRVVQFGGVRYCEGMLQHELDRLVDDEFERRDGERPNRTQRSRPC